MIALEVLSPQPPSNWSPQATEAVKLAESIVVRQLLMRSAIVPTVELIAAELVKRERHGALPDRLTPDALYERFETLRRHSMGFSVVVEAFNFKPIGPVLERVRFRLPPELAAQQRTWYLTYRTPYLLARLLALPEIKGKGDWSPLINKLTAAGYLDKKSRPVTHSLMPPIPGGDQYAMDVLLVPEEHLVPA